MELKHYEQLDYAQLLPRNVDVWVPAEYEQSKIQRFSVLYLHDGQNLFEPDKSYSGVTWGIAEAVTALVRQNIIEPVIVVGIWNTENRMGDYQPLKPFDTPKGEKFKRLAKKNRQLKKFSFVSDQYLEFIVKKLKPMIDHDFRTKPDRENTFIMGSSMGGLISLYAICEYPHVFGGAGCLSTHWPIVRQVILPYLETSLPDPKTHKIYFDRGTKELDSKYRKGQEAVDALMIKKGYAADKNWMTRIYEGHKHHETFWKERIDVPLTFLFGNNQGKGAI